jgi:hypothetical protein
MPAPKGLTKQLPLRMTDDERKLIETVQEVYGREGITLSLNDTVRHLIRRAGIVLAHSREAAEDQIREHCDGCPLCDCEAVTYGCPDGLYLYRNYRRLRRAQQREQSD